jgi:hypothetical protein
MIRNSKKIQRVAATAGLTFVAAVTPLVFSNQANGQSSPTDANGSTIYPVSVPAQPAVTAQVAGIQVTTTPATTVAPTTAAVSVAGVTVVAVSPTVEVLGIQEEAGEVALTGANSGTYTAAGIALTAAGAVLIGATRRRRRSE